MPVELEDAIEAAEELVVLRFFPPGDAGLVKVAQMIRELCRNRDEAQALVRELLSTGNDWPGPETLRTVYREMTQGWGEVPVYEKPTGLCPKCDSWGHYPDENGLRVRCPLGCENSRDIPDEFIALLNAGRLKTLSQPPPEPKPKPRPITQADIEAVLAGRKR